MLPPPPSSTPRQAGPFAPLAPFDNLQSNARIITPSSTSLGLGLGLGLSLSLPLSVQDDVRLGDPQFHLESSQSHDLMNESAHSSHSVEALPSRFSSLPLFETDLNPSSSAFSIGDWIVHPPSSPGPLDVMCSSSLHIPSPPGPSSGPPDTPANLNLPPLLSTVPETPVGINPAMLTASHPQSPLNITDGSRKLTAETVFFQVIERLYLSLIPTTGCLTPGPGQTSMSRKDHPSPRDSELPQPLNLMLPGPELHRFPDNSLFTPVVQETSNAPTSANLVAVSSSSFSSRDTSSNSRALSPLVSPDTPMFNIHEGISEYDVQRRAHRYRRRYPGRKLDRHWLLKYAGKLNKDGKAMEDYRCYISGCAQVNKRRDHIIVHICSHVNERPHTCRYCHMTFLRRNECKRHEAGHSGLKPFVCRLCPPPAARFARQDLLTRHARRAHDMTAPEQRDMRH
ncbi:hypothetical protein B0F90DRAFT_1686637 [Multifurca ochricompacta]|uniref:C2H2-type domain-containing protein n=1 Tax=Multifurca ochricompacta TaxID=376703 RepID=A0AAD4MBB1_9AGAM|nr:hypothetical protein B0F90DRAFT_1686637 [Multifurca ochricompacta]